MESDELTSDDTSSDGPQELECHCDVTCFASTLPPRVHIAVLVASVPIIRQAHVTHVIDGFVLGHRSCKHVSIRLGADLG